MKKREIETYMDAFMEGFWQCYDMMMDMIDDDESSQDLAEPSQGIVKEEPVKEEPKPVPPQISEKPPVVSKPSKPKDEPRQAKKEPHAPERQKIQKIDRGKVCALLDAGWKVPKIAGEMHASEATIYNIQKQHREEKAKQETQA